MDVIGSTNGYIRVDRDHLRRIRVVGDEHQLVFDATGMRRERTGFHARVEILMNGTSLAHDTFNIERNSERVTLTNAAFGQAFPTKERQLPTYPKEFMKADVDSFCAGLQAAFVQGQLPKKMAGSEQRREPRFVLKPYVLWRGGTILFAPPGTGKSYILWLMAVSIDAGISTLWLVEETPVLVVNLERSEDSVADRLGNINAVLGFPRSRPLHVLNARGRTLEQMQAPIAAYIKSEGIGCLMLDSMSRAGKGSLLDDDVVNAYCDILNAFEISWLALAHSPRADNSHVFGSQMFDAAADLIVKLDSYTRPNGLMGISLDVTKRNDIAQQPTWIGSLGFDDAGLTSVRRAMRGEFMALESTVDKPMDEKVIAWLAKVGARSASQVASDLGLSRQNVSSLLSNDGRFTVVKKEGASVLYGLAAVSGASVVHDTSTRHMPPESTRHIDDTSTNEELPF